jgi:hypothetical protein
MLTSATCSRVLQPHHTNPTDRFPFDSAATNIISLFEAEKWDGCLFCVGINYYFFLAGCKYILVFSKLILFLKLVLSICSVIGTFRYGTFHPLSLIMKWEELCVIFYL